MLNLVCKIRRAEAPSSEPIIEAARSHHRSERRMVTHHEELNSFQKGAEVRYRPLFAERLFYNAAEILLTWGWPPTEVSHREVLPVRLLLQQRTFQLIIAGIYPSNRNGHPPSVSLESGEPGGVP